MLFFARKSLSYGMAFPCPKLRSFILEYRFNIAGRETLDARVLNGAS